MPSAIHRANRIILSARHLQGSTLVGSQGINNHEMSGDALAAVVGADRVAGSTALSNMAIVETGNQLPAAEHSNHVDSSLSRVRGIAGTLGAAAMRLKR